MLRPRRDCTPTTISSPSRSRGSSPASFSAMSAHSSRLRATRSAELRLWTLPTSATPTRSHCSARARSGASTPTTRRPLRTRGTRRPRLAGRKSLRPSPPLLDRRLTHIESGYGQIVGGAGAYVFWNDMLYADLTFYKGLPVPVLQAFNTGNSTTDALSNVAPYWRVAIEPHWGDLYLGGWHIRHVRAGHPWPPIRLRDRQFSRRRFRLANPICWRSIQHNREADRYHGMAAVELVLRARRYRRTSTTRSTASRPTRHSSGTTPTASALAISTSPAPATAIFTDRATTPIARPPASASSTTALSAVPTAPASSKISPTSPSVTALRFPTRP